MELVNESLKAALTDVEKHKLVLANKKNKLKMKAITNSRFHQNHATPC